MLFGGSMQRTKKNHGFTLIELMVTIAVMAIIATMAAPSFNNNLSSMKNIHFFSIFLNVGLLGFKQ